MDARRRQRRALGAGARGALRGAFALGAVVRIQEVPFPDKVNAAVVLTGAFLLPGHREAASRLCVKEERQDGRAYCALAKIHHFFVPSFFLLVYQETFNQQRVEDAMVQTKFDV